MADFNALEALINANIKKNGVQAITGNILNGILRGMVSALGKGYTIAGSVTPSSDPGTMTGPVAYIAYTAGTYTHFDGLEVEQGEVAMLIYNEAEWHKEVLYSLAATATVDGNVGTPEVGVSFVDGLLTFDFRNMKGEPGVNGQDGEAAGFGAVTASVDASVGTPSVTVSSSGPNTAKSFAFSFHNLKGEQGVQGIQGIQGPQGVQGEQGVQGPVGVESCVVTVDNTSGTPSCSVSLVGQVLHLDFTGLKGLQGDTGSSVDYPFTIVNNLTTNDATQALSAAMGVQLESEVSQLEAKVDDIDDKIGDTGYQVSRPELTFTSGYINYPDGRQLGSTVNSCSNAISVEGFDEIEYLSNTTTSSSSSAAAAFYDANGNHIGSIAIEITSQQEEKIYTANVPTNAKTFRFTVRNDYVADAYVKLTKGKSLVDDLEEQLEPLAGIPSRVSAVESRFDGSRKNWESGYLDADGVVQSSTADIITDFIPVSAGSSVVWYNGYEESKSVYLQVYDYNGTLKASYRRSANETPSRTFTLENDSGVWFIRATMSATNPNVYIKVDGVTKWIRKDTADGVFEHPIDSLGTIETIYGENTYQGWKSGIVHKTTGVYMGSTVNSCTGYINIKGLKKIEITQSITTAASDAGICFYDEDGTFISGIGPEQGTVKDYKTITIDVPENAYYLRASIYNDQTEYWHLVGIIPSTLELSLPIVPPMLGSPELYFSGETSESAESITTKTSADLYDEYDALVSAYPQYFKRNADLGNVTYNGNTYAVRSYTLGYNKQTLIDHEPTADEVISPSANKWTTDLNPRKILLVSGMHGEEHTPCWGMMLAIGDILSSDEPWAHYIKDNFIFEVIPCVNPAGWSAHIRADSQGHIMNRDEAIDDPESTYYMDWVDDNKDAFILIDCHGTQGRYAYLPVMQKLPISKMVYGLANKLACAFFNNWKAFYDAISNGYGTTYAPFMVAKYTGDSAWTRGRYAVRMYQDYGMQSLALETPDDLVTGAIGNNDLRNCKLTKDIFINVLQSVCQMQVLPD